MAEPEKDKVKLPRRPLYQWFYDGAKTRKIIEWLMALDDSSGDLGDIDLNNPELQAILQALANRITSLENTISAFPNMANLVSRINALEGTSTQHGNSIATILTDLEDSIDRITTLEGLINGTTGIDGVIKKLDDLEEEISNLSSTGNILPIPNSTIADVLQ